MAQNDLVLQKMLRVTPETHARVMQVIAEIQARTKVNTTANDAVRVLLDGWKELERISKEDVPVFTDEGQVMGSVTTGFTDKYFD